MKKFIAKLLICAVCISSICIPAYAQDDVQENISIQATKAPITTRAHDMEYNNK